MKPSKYVARLALCACVLAVVAFCVAQDERSGSQPPTTRSSSGKPSELTVAVLDFSANTPGEPGLGAQISDALTAMLSGEPGFRLVDRAVLARTLKEQELNLSGVVDTNQAIKVGKLIGARILVAGKAFPMGNKMFITAKLIGTETSLVDGVIVKSTAAADIGELVIELAEKLASRLREVGPKLVAQDDAGQNPLPALKAKLAQLRKPTVAVIIPERHMAQWSSIPDPAVETEIKRLLQECGFTVQDVGQNELADFARNFRKTDRDAWPRQLSGVDVVIVGEGFSEFAARIGNLVSCAARAEVNVIDRRTGEVLQADRTTQRGVDLSENIAGKNALQSAGRVLGIRVLQYFSANLPPDEKKSR